MKIEQLTLCTMGGGTTSRYFVHIAHIYMEADLNELSCLRLSVLSGAASYPENRYYNQEVI